MCVCLRVCISRPASFAIYSLWDLVYCALSKCQRCQSGPPISHSPCCWALPVFISADRWTLRVIPPMRAPTHTHVHSHLHPSIHSSIYFLSNHPFFSFPLVSSALLFILYRAPCLFWSCVWLRIYHVWHIPSHLMALPMLPVSPGTPPWATQLHTQKHTLWECDLYPLQQWKHNVLLFDFDKLCSRPFMQHQLIRVGDADHIRRDFKPRSETLGLDSWACAIFKQDHFLPQSIHLCFLVYFAKSNGTIAVWRTSLIFLLWSSCRTKGSATQGLNVCWTLQVRNRTSVEHQQFMAKGSKSENQLLCVRFKYKV